MQGQPLNSVSISSSLLIRYQVERTTCSRRKCRAACVASRGVHSTCKLPAYHTLFYTVSRDIHSKISYFEHRMSRCGLALLHMHCNNGVRSHSRAPSPSAQSAYLLPLYQFPLLSTIEKSTTRVSQHMYGQSAGIRRSKHHDYGLDILSRLSICYCYF